MQKQTLKDYIKSFIQLNEKTTTKPVKTMKCSNCGTPMVAVYRDGDYDETLCPKCDKKELTEDAKTVDGTPMTLGELVARQTIAPDWLTQLVKTHGKDKKVVPVYRWTIGNRYLVNVKE